VCCLLPLKHESRASEFVIQYDWIPDGGRDAWSEKNEGACGVSAASFKCPHRRSCAASPRSPTTAPTGAPLRDAIDQFVDSELAPRDAEIATFKTQVADLKRKFDKTRPVFADFPQ